MFKYILVLLVFIQSYFSQKTYEGAQLLRLTNIDNATTNSEFLDILTNKYGGIIWKQLPTSSDISFEHENLSEIKDYIKNHGVEFDVLIPDLQEVVNYSSEANRTKRDTTLDWTNYHRYNTIVDFLYSLAKKYPKFVNAIEIGKTIENRKLLVLRITNNVDNDAIFLEGGIHAREWISPAAVTYIANYIVNNWNSDSSLNTKTWYILPLLNADGYEYSHTNERLWRKNRKKWKNTKCVGVDLNRNFGADWNNPSQISDICKDTFKGETAFSERESDAIKNFLLSKKSKLKAYLAYHSYSQLILWPYGYAKAYEAPNTPAMRKTAETAVANIKLLTGSIYIPARSNALYFIYGSSNDWAKEVLGTPFAYTIELRDKGYYGFLLPPNEILRTAVEALEVAKVVAKAI